jgi:hypothetical protein
MRKGRPAVCTALTVLGAAGLTFFQFRHTIGYGFDYDDYHFVRPYSTADVLRAFLGPWDASGIEVPFYRPLTIVLYATRFAAFGLNSEAYHVLSLAMFAVAAALVGWFVMQTVGRPWPAVLAVTLFVCHPSFPYSAVVWATNQMHLLELLVVMSALCWWSLVRRRTVVWWLPLLACEAAALLIKEDGVMLFPAIVAVHLARKYLVERELPNVPRTFILSSVLMLGTLLAIRYSALHGVGGYRSPTVSGAWSNVTAGLSAVYTQTPAKRAYQPVASWFVTLLPIAALVSWKRMPPATRFGLAAGALVSVLFDLPFVFIVKGEQLYMVATGAVLVLAASGTTLIQAFPGLLTRVGGITILAGGISAMAAVSRDISRDFEPFGPIVLHHDTLVSGWAAVPVEIREYLVEKARPGARGRVSPNPAEAIASVAFGVHSWETAPGGIRIRWMSGPTTDLYVRPTARSLRLPFRHEFGVFREPVPVTISAEGRTLDRIVVQDGAWHESVISLPPVARFSPARMHHVEVRIPHAWIPSVIIPQAQDTRTLGLQLGAVEPR